MASSYDSSDVVYAGFWLRVVAALIDGILLAVIGFIAGAVLGGVMGGSMGAAGSSVEEIQRAVLLPSYLLGIVINIVYYAGMESSSRQATLGKSAMGLIVTTVDGDRLTLGRAVGRVLGKYLSGLILGIGFLMVAFTDKKQGLHDILASTLVVKK